MKRCLQLWIVGLVLFAGCTTYYQVHDVSTGKTYYTTGLKYKGSGAVTFKDRQSGANVVLQESEVKNISKERFEENTKKP